MQEFIDAMRSSGVGPDNPADIVADDTIRRYKVEGDKARTKNGVYCVKFDGDGFGVGWYMSHKAGEVHSWHTKAKRDVSPEDRAVHKRKIEQARRDRKASIKKQHDEAAEKAAEIWRGSDRDGINEYLDRKRIGLNGARMYKGMVAVPMYKDAKLIGLQFIGGGGTKRFLTGVDKTGSYHSMRGPDMSVIRICEGFATGAALRDCYPDNPVIVAWDAGNLKPVARAMAVKYPDARIVICGDNDQWTSDHKGNPWNPGADKAGQAAAAIGGAQVFLPPFEDDDADKRTDWWDYWAAYGADAVRDAMVVVDPVVAPVETPLDGGEVVYEDRLPEHLKAIRPLGYDKGKFYFLPDGTGQIAKYSSRELANLGNLLTLAPLSFWEMYFDVDGKGAVDKMVRFAADTLITACKMKGVFKPRNIRSVGAWRDGDKYIVHTGAKIIHGDDEILPNDFAGKYVYENGETLIDLSHGPATDDQVRGLYDICQSLTWKKKQYADVLAGWLVVAPFGGALSWRPHIWITGRSGAGKSTVMDEIVKPLVGDFCVTMSGSSSEPGVRRQLDGSSLPFIMDEAEGEKEGTRKKMESIINLFRMASSGGKYVDANGEISIMSCACFAAINPSVTEGADKSRITLIELEKDMRHGSADRFKDLMHKISNIITDDFHRQMIARTAKNIERLMKNIKAFHTAASILFRDARLADQLSPLIAGSHSLVSNEEMTSHTATEWLKSQDWDWFISENEGSDADKLVSHIMTSRISYDVMGARREGAIGDLVDQVIEGSEGSVDIHRGLRSYGIKVDGEWVHVANGSHNMSKLLRDTPWVPWARTLGDYPGSGNNDNKTVYFMRGVTSKVTSIPVDALRDMSMVASGDEVEIDAWDEGDFG